VEDKFQTDLNQFKKDLCESNAKNQDANTSITKMISKIENGLKITDTKLDTEANSIKNQISELET